MILVPIILWLGFLWVLVKLGVLKRWHLWMKISPVVIWLTAMLVIFLPLNWNAPKAGATVTVGSQGIKPAVSGPVTEVAAQSWTPIAEGDVLFEIDKAKYLAAVNKTKAELALAEDQLSRKQTLLERQAVAETEVEALRAEVEVVRADLALAQIDLENTTVRAPFRGIVPATTLLPSDRVAAGVPVMAFLDIDNPVVNVVLKQNQIRNVMEGQRAEATFKTFPGRVFQGTVSGVFLSAPTAEYTLDGATPEVPEVIDTTYVATLDLELEGVSLPPGSSGQGAIYTDQGTEFHVLQQVTLRMTAWMNYF
ncbi:efflux RND transporter periplasmic adaptor subunit [Tropicimonas sp. TH_r6]|uniref:HlyD family secretion protein n=1 Tax=Tropicimonas sp. TH_r6 TaxID=3082085 RepID=UPI0029536BA1|nr:efflux RND transporter periplasmic adaptor subunit [Tropicimonas sp. TH_r6]MDV7146001.1 efflux RND transporter periplasmic adaptor subunit [Tropicimonas sp. TH_r6]